MIIAVLLLIVYDMGRLLCESNALLANQIT